jgi:hypothetical protein
VGLGPSSEGPTRYDLEELLNGRALPGPGVVAESDGLEFTRFAMVWPLSDLRFIGGFATAFRPEFHYDYLPAGPSAVRLLLLTNIEGQGRPAAKTDKLEMRAFARPNQKEPKWTFACYSVRAKWDRDAKDPGWQPEAWKEEGTLEVAFREPFQALSRGDDYYFATASGKLFRAPKPAGRGKHRKVVPVWDDARAPITALVTDADKGRTFLFVEKGPKGVGGPFVFELADGVRLRAYDPGLCRPGAEGPDALRRVVGYARVLAALGYVDAAAPKKDQKR